MTVILELPDQKGSPSVGTAKHRISKRIAEVVSDALDIAGARAAKLLAAKLCRRVRRQPPSRRRTWRATIAKVRAINETIPITCDGDNL